MRHGDAVAGHAPVAAVEVGRVHLVEGRLAPVPVGLVALVVALVPQRLLVRPGEITMPREEVGLQERLGQHGRADAGSIQAGRTVPWITGVIMMWVARKSS